MATLRGNQSLLRTPQVSLEDMENFRAQQMGETRRAFTSGRIGTEVNAALADLATARAKGDEQRAGELADQIDGLRNRQEMYAHQGTSRLEDIRGPGDVLSFVRQAVGSGAASMLDPVAAAAASTAVGTGLRMIPTPLTQGVGMGLQTVGAFGAPFAINQRQLKGEFYGQALEDPTIMANTSAQDLNRRAELQGVAGSAAESIVPGFLGRAIGGAGLARGATKGLGMGFGTKVGLGLTGEGAAEVASNEMARAGLRSLNPERVDENVGWDRANEFAQGFIGAGPITAGGAALDSGFRRIGATANEAAGLVKEGAGAVVDMYDGSVVQQGVDKASGLLRRSRDKVVDLYQDGVTAKDIKDTLKEKTKGVFDAMDQTEREYSILTGDVAMNINPEAPDFREQFLRADQERNELILSKLQKMAESDLRANELLQQAMAPDLDPETRGSILDQAADYVIETSQVGDFLNKTEKTGSVAGRMAGAAARLMGRAGGVLWDATKGALKGASEGFNEGRKLNAQVWTEADWEAEMGNRRQAGERALSLERAKNFAAYLEDGVRSRAERFQAVKPGVDLDRVAKYVGDLGYEIADLAEQWAPILDQRPTREQSQERSEANNARLRERQRADADKNSAVDTQGVPPARTANQGGPQSLLQSDAPNFDALVLALNRIANDLNSAFGKDAAKELAEIGRMAAPESASFFRYLEEQLGVVQSKQGARATADIRRQAQNEIMRAFDPETTQRLLKAGINVHKPEGKRMLLGMVEAIYTGRAGRGFDKELAKVLGQDVLDGMLQALDTQTQQFAAEYINDADVIEGNNGLEMTEDGDIVESNQRLSNMIEKQAQRAVDKQSGGKMLGFFGMDKPRIDRGKGDPFRTGERVSAAHLKEWEDHVRQRKLEGLEPDWDNDPRHMGRPRLIPNDNAQAAERAIKLMEHRLKVDRTPERMLEMLKEEAAQSMNSRSADASRAGPNREVRAVAAVEQKMAAAAAGNEKARAWLEERTEAYFTNRAGSWRVAPQSAADIMRERGMTDRIQVLSLYRDYMRQEAARNEKAAATTRGKTPQNTEAIANYEEKAKAANYEARVASQALLDAMDQNKTKADGTKRENRLGPEVRQQVFKRARDYFASHSVVVAERLSDRDPNVLSAEDILDLHAQGQRAVDAARRDGAKVLNQRGVLTFSSALAGNKEGKVYIPAAKLVYMARERRMMSEPVDFENTDGRFSNADKNQQYLRDLLDGIGMMLASGHINGLPTAYDKNGKPQEFELKERVGKDGKKIGDAHLGIPSDLMLATSTYGNMDYGRKQRVAKGPSKLQKYLDGLDDQEFNERRQARVANDQARNEEPFVADSRMDQEPSGTKIKKPRSGQRAQFAEFDNLNDTVTRGEEGGGRYTERRITDNRTDRKPHEAKVDSEQGKKTLSRKGIKPDNATPLDFFKKQDPRKAEQRDEFAEQRRQSIMEGKVATGVKSMAFKKGRMEVDGVARGNELVGQLQSDPANGTETLLNWLRMAARPEFDGKGGVVGGLHLAMPAAVALNKDTMSTYDPEDVGQLMEIRKELARIIRDSDASPTVKVAIMRAMAPADQVAKITAQTLPKMLEAVKGERAVLGEADTSTRTKREINAASDKALADYQAGLKNKAPAKEGGAPVGKPQAGTGSGKLNVWFGSGENAHFSNLAPRPFTLDGKAYRSVEHAYQTLKSGTFDAETYAKYNRDGVKIVGTKGTKTEGNWNINLMNRLVLESFIQNPDAAKALMATGDAKFTHTQDTGVWRNAFPAALNAARTALKESQAGTGSAKAFIQVNDHKSSGYRARTAFNANSADMTVAIAKDLTTAGERLTKNVAGQNYMSFGFNDARADGRALAQEMKRRGATSLNVAGNGIYTLAKFGMTQPQVNQYVYDLLSEVHRLNPLTKIVSGGQTGVDIAGAVAARALGIPAVITLPQGFLQRNAQGVDQRLSREAVTQQIESGAAALSVRKLNAQTQAHTITSAVDEISVTGTAQSFGDATIVEAQTYEEMYGEPQTPPNKVYAYGTTPDGDYFSGWYGSVGEAVNALRKEGIDGELQPYDPPASSWADDMFNKQTGGPAGSPKESTWQERSQAINFIRTVLGNDIKVDFKDITGYSGEWIEARNVIEIATTSAPGALQVAYHEALHAFFSKFAKNNPEVRQVLQSLVMNPELNARTKALLSQYPAALKQFEESAEERLAYIFQFWNAGMLDLPGEAPKNLFQKLAEFFRRVMGRVTDSERATAVLEAFREGRLAGSPSDAGKVIAEAIEKGTWTTKKLRKIDKLMDKARSLVLPAQTILNTSDSPTARKLGVMFWTNPGEAEHGSAEEGYLNARLRHPRQYKNLLNNAISGLTDRDLNEVARYLQMEKDNLDEIAYAPQREAAKKIRSLLQRFRKYMVDESGLEMGDRGPYYFPRVWNHDTLMRDGDKFMQMLKDKYDHVLTQGVVSSGNKLTKDDVARRILNSLVHHAVSDNHIGPSREDGVLAPFFAQKEVREMAWLDSADAEPFMEKQIITTLTQYFHNGSRAAEYTRRFGNRGEKLDRMLETVEEELRAAAEKKLGNKEFDTKKQADEWVNRQIQRTHHAIGAMEGTLGKDISSLWRETSAWATVYQNLRLLPLTIFASVVDPLGMVARGATMSEAFDTFMRGMKEVIRGWKDMMSKNPDVRAGDKWDQLARAVGAVDAAMFSHFVSDEYSSVYMNKSAKKINDLFFQLNGMEGWNRGVRAGATKSAAMFLQRHKSLPDKAHSKRWLQELGLTPDDIHLDSNGELITDWRTLSSETGMSQAQAQANIAKIHYALARWVEGAIITPNAAQRPGWSSDPHYSLFFHLKQFMYSFHMTILKRGVKEMQHGNMAPIGAFLWYVPVMIASDITKGLIQGGGELPAYMQRMDAGDWVLHGIERAGLLGVGTIGVDAHQDIFSLAGPMVEQITDSFSQDLGSMTLRALPANPLYRNWVE